MFIFTLTLLLTAWTSLCVAAPADHEKRQKDVTYTVTCIGKTCTNYPPTSLTIPTNIPTFWPPTTTAKTTTAKTTTKKPTTEPTTLPTKTTKTQKPTTTRTEEEGPSSTRCPVPLYYKCGGWDVDKPWEGCTVCVKGAICVVQNEWYSQCVADDGTQ